MNHLTVAYDARFLQPKTRHWGVGVVIENIIKRLNGNFNFVGLTHRFPARMGDNFRYWPSFPLANRLLFEISPFFVRDCDVYWATAHFLPEFVRRPSVLTVYDMLLLNEFGNRRFAGFFASRFRSSLARATRIVAISKTTADDLTAEYPDLKKRLEVVLLGYDAPQLESAAVSPEVEIPSSPYMVMLGCHHPRKNLDLAVAAVSRLREDGIDIQLLVTGDVHPSFRRTLRSCREGVRALGALPKQTVFALLESAVCVLFPSRYEGFGLPLLEAMAAGCPVLALDIPINREIAGDAACLLPEDADRWAKACKQVLKVRGVREDMRGRGFENLSRFSWEKCAASYGEIFNQVTS